MLPDARWLITSLIGQTIFTLGRDRPNTIKSIEGENVIVATQRSPDGKPVPLSLVQMGLTKLQDTGELRVNPESFGGRRRSSFIGAAIATLPDVAVEHRPAVRLLVGDAHNEAAVQPIASGAAGYPDPETGSIVDDAGVKVALRAISKRYRQHRVIEMPHNNPGFDVLVLGPHNETEYIEIKSTSGPTPTFFMSEQQRLFAEKHSAGHHLLVVTNVDVDAVTGDVRWHDGPLTTPDVELAPQQWKGRLT